MGLTVREAHNCSSIRQNRAPTRACKQAFITSHSWSRAERSYGKHTTGRVHGTPSSWTNPASSPSTARTVCDLLARSSWIQARSRLPHPGGERLGTKQALFRLRTGHRATDNVG